MDFLLCEDVAVSYTAKLALSRALKPQVFGKNNQNLVRGDHSFKESVEGNQINKIFVILLYNNFDLIFLCSKRII